MKRLANALPLIAAFSLLLIWIGVLAKDKARTNERLAAGGGVVDEPRVVDLKKWAAAADKPTSQPVRSLVEINRDINRNLKEVNGSIRKLALLYQEQMQAEIEEAKLRKK